MASNWWDSPESDETAQNPLITPYSVGLGVPRLNGQRLGSFRLQALARDLLARQQLEQRLFPAQPSPQPSTGVVPGVPGQGEGANPLVQNLPEIPTPLVQAQPQEAPTWWDKPGTPLGDFEREFARGNILQKGLATLGVALRPFGALAQGTEGVAGLLGNLPDVQVQGGGRVELKPSLNQQMMTTGQAYQQALGQDYTTKYRSQANVMEKPLGAEDPVTWSMYQTRNVAYSGAEAQKAAALRVQAGEDPTVVLRGVQAPGEGAYKDEVERYQTAAQEYVDAQGRLAKAAALQVKQLPDARWGTVEKYADAMEQKARQNAAEWINAYQRVPGVEEPVREMVGQIALDPMNLPQVNKAQEILLKPVMGKLKGTTQAVERVTQAYDDSMKATVEAVKTGVGPRVQAVGTKLNTAAETRNNPLLNVINGTFKKGVSLFSFTPQTQAKVLNGVAYQQLGNLATAAENGPQMSTWLKSFVENPQALVEMSGVVPTSLDAEVARPVVKDALQKLQALPSLKAGMEFNPGTFLKEADPILTDVSNKLAKVPEKPAAWMKVSQDLKSWMSEFMLKTPGYVIRNWVSDNVIASMDGLRMFENQERITRDLERFGVSTRRLGEGGIVADIGATSKLAGIPGIGTVQTKIGQIASDAEKTRYTRAFWSALTDFIGTNWKPQMSRETAELFRAAGREDVIQALEGGITGARSGKEIRARAYSILDATNPAERFFVTQHVGVNDLPVDVAAQIETDIRRMHSEGATTEQMDAYLADWETRLSEHTKSRLIDLGPVISPRDTTEQDALLDVEENVRAMQRDLGRAVNHGDMTQEEAAKALDEFRTGQVAQARQLAQARSELAQAFGALGENVKDEHVAAVLHALDGEYDLRSDTRLVADARRRQAWQQKPDRGVWDAYRADVAQIWGDAGNKTIQQYRDAAAALNELSSGANPAEVMQKYGITATTQRAENSLRRARETIAPLDVYAPANWKAPYEGVSEPVAEASAKRLADNALKFDTSLSGARDAWDAARNESRRRLIQMVNANPQMAQDGFDVFRAAERDVQRRWDQYIGVKNQLLALKDDGKITLEEYGKRLGDEAKKAFEFSTRRHGELLIAQLEGVELGRSEIAQRLKGLGYSGDELKRLVTGIGDGSTRDEVAGILQQGKRAPAAPEAATGVAETTGPRFTEMNPPASGDELMQALGVQPTEEGMQQALEHARQQQAIAESLTDTGLVEAKAEARGRLPTAQEIDRYLRADGTLKPGDHGSAIREMGQRFGVTFDDNVTGGAEESFRQWLVGARDTRRGGTSGQMAAAKRDAETAGKAAEQWNKVAEELQTRLDQARGVSEEIRTQRAAARQMIEEDGLAKAAGTIRAITDAGTEIDQAVLDELAQVARERTLVALDSAPDVEQGFKDAERVLAEALFGEEDVMALSRARDVFQKQAGISVIPGLETETRVETIRAMAQAMGLNPDEFVRGETTAQGVIEQARKANNGLVDKVLGAETVHADGRIKAEPWKELGVEGERRKPGDILKELAAQGQAKDAATQAAQGQLAQRVAGVKTYDELKNAVGDGYTVGMSSDPGAVYVYVTDAQSGRRYTGSGRSKDEAVADLVARLGPSPQPSPGVPGEGAVQAATSGEVKTTYTTERGSTYQVYSDGTTVRNKSYHPEHGAADQGLKAQSQKTVYVTHDQVGGPQIMYTQGDVLKDKRIVLDFNAKKGYIEYTNSAGKRVGDANSRFDFTTEPAVGLHPVEVWQDGQDIHVGNKITSIGNATAATSGGAATQEIPEEVQRAEERAAKWQKRVSELKQQITASADQVEAAHFKTQLEEAQAKAKTAGMQASAARRKYGIRPPSERAGVQGSAGAGEIATRGKAVDPQVVAGLRSEMVRYRQERDTAQAALQSATDVVARRNAQAALDNAEMHLTGFTDEARQRGIPLDTDGLPSVPATATSGVDELSGEQLVELDRLRESTPNMDPPTMDEQITAAERQQVAAVRKLRSGLGASWGQMLPGEAMPAGARVAVEKEVKRLASQWQELRAAAIAHSQARADFSLLDYTSKRGIDMMIGAFAPYSYWGTRQGRNFAVRMLEHPQMLVNYMRYQDAMKKENTRRGYRQRFEGGWEIPLGDGGFSVFVDPVSMMFPFADLVKTDWDDSSDSKSTLAQIYDAAGSLGLRPAPWIDIPLRMSNLMVSAQAGTPEYEQQQAEYGKNSVGALIPQAQMIKGATAIAGVGTPGGIDLERPARRFLGLPEGQPYEPYTLARSVRDLAAEEQQRLAQGGQTFNNAPYLLAQAIIASYGNERYGAMLESATSGDVAKEFGATTAEAQQALQIVRDAAQRSGAQAGVRTLASGLLGQRAQVMTPGERLYGQMQATERSVAYSPYTQTGSREEVLAAREAMPAIGVGQAQYATLPGEDTSPQSIYQNSQRDEINRAFDTLRDAVIANRPYDRKAVYTIEDARGQALDGVSGEQAADWRKAYANAVAVISGQQLESATSGEYRPRSIAGASPQEAEQIRKDEVMRYVSATRPQLEQFQTTSGYPDYDAYDVAVAKWEAALPSIAAQSPLVAQVIAQAKGEGRDIGEFVKGITPDDVQTYWRRNDSPVEAAQRAYFEQVYTPAVQQAKGKGKTVVEARLPDVGATSTSGLIDLVMKQYPGRWTREELQQQLGEMEMPDLQTVVRAQMTPAAQEKAAKADEFVAYVTQKWGKRGATAYTAYVSAEGADAKAKVRKRYAVLSRILAARTEYMAQ